MEPVGAALCRDYGYIQYILTVLFHSPGCPAEILRSNLWAIARQDIVCFLEINILGWRDCASGAALLRERN